MPLYHYEGFDLKGRIVGGELQAESVADMQCHMAQQGIVVEKHRTLDARRKFSRYKEINSAELYLVLQEFIALLSAGYSLHYVLKMLADRPDKNVTGTILQSVAMQVATGESLSTVAMKYPSMFDHFLIASIRIGEKTGDLVNPVKHYISYLQTRMSLERTIRQAMAYPLFLLLMLVAVLVGLFVFVLPRFAEMYAGFDAQLPAPTLLLLQVVERFHYVALGFGVISIMIVMTYKWLTGTEQGRIARDRAILHLPVLGKLLQYFYVAQITRVLAVLLRSGVTLLDAMQHAASGLRNSFLRSHMLEASRRITEGVSLSRSLETVDLFSDKSRGLIKAGEESGQLDSLLQKVSEFHEELLKYNVSRAMALIEPIMMLIIGILVGGIILVMYLPIFSIVDIVQ